jgi:hypothetical protein
MACVSCVCVGLDPTGAVSEGILNKTAPAAELLLLLRLVTEEHSGLEEFKQLVEHLRLLADTQTGMVIGLLYFSHRKSSLVDPFDKEWETWLNEFFKIQNRKLVGIHAIMVLSL